MCLVFLKLAIEALRHDGRPDHPVLLTLSKFRGVFRIQSTSTMEIFLRKSHQLLVVKYFCKKAPS